MKSPESVADLIPHEKNPRVMTDAKRKMLKKSMREFGDLGGIIFNVRSRKLIGGHQRRAELSADTPISIDRTYEPPTRTGTVAEGHILIDGERFTYREVSVDDRTEKAMNIAANKHGGEFDLPGLKEWIHELDHANLDLDLIGFSPEELADLMAPTKESGTSGVGYSSKIESPIYEPKGPRPPLSDLFDSGKSKDLIERIRAAGIPDAEKEFLMIAATRHVVFDYEKIAEYYSHADAELQSLMEDSALVIIDFKKAIENGFVVLSEAIAEAYKNAK